MIETRRRVLLLAAAFSAVGLCNAPSFAADSGDKGITIVLPGEPPGLDGCNSDQGNIGRVIKNNVVESLTEIGVDGTVLPRLATSWTQVDDKTWRFELRQGVKYQDGAPFNASTLVTSIMRTMATDSVTAADGNGKTGLACRTRLKYFNDFKITPKAVGDYTLEISADKPVPTLPTLMSMVSLSSPNEPADQLVRAPIGTGPYVLDHWTAGEEIVLKRNDAYWGDKPEVEQAKFIWRSESSVRAAMVKLGEADMAPIIAIQDADNPSTDYSYLNSETTWLRIDMQTPPFNDIRVRQALNYAIDRAGIRDALLSKDSILAEQPVVPSIPGHNKDLDANPWPYDPAKAKELLDAARKDGAPLDKEIVLIARPTDFANIQDAMEAIVDMYKAVGLNVTLSMRESAQWTEALKKPFAADRGPTLLENSHDNNTGDPVISVAHFFACDGDVSMMCDPKFDAMVDKATVTPTGPDRFKQWSDIFKTLHDDYVPNVWLYHMIGYSRVGPRIDFKPSITTNSEIQIARIKFK